MRVIESVNVTRLVEEHALLLEALIAFRDGGPNGGQNFNGWHESYGPAIEKAQAAIAATEREAPTAP